jgi:hypothetical protein
LGRGERGEICARRSPGLVTAIGTVAVVVVDAGEGNGN